ncbi:hypothetical protein T190607A01A_30152 [Tenacibaculum sp. 190524A05c]|uniref:Uncharacterized protein n=1 Tax=Tenacibaculum platacis TaxID=3137852 RepID=A0ABM9P2W3_9FLAO
MTQKVYLSLCFEYFMYICTHNSKHAGVVELVDTLDLGSSAARRGGSTPFTRTS